MAQGKRVLFLGQLNARKVTALDFPVFQVLHACVAQSRHTLNVLFFPEVLEVVFAPALHAAKAP